MDVLVLTSLKSLFINAGVEFQIASRAGEIKTKEGSRPEERGPRNNKKSSILEPRSSSLRMPRSG
jgi:hypothetical protein